MRTHTTKTLKDLVMIQMDPNKHQMTPQAIDVWIQTIPEITKEMFDTIHFLTSHIFNKSLIIRQFQQIHRECIYLLDKLDKMDQLDTALKQLKAELIKSLGLIIEKMMSDYCKYLDLDIWMPLIHLRLEQSKITAGSIALADRFNILEVDAKFQKVIFAGMVEAEKASRHTYERISYILMLQEALINCCKGACKATVRSALLFILIERNYNTDVFIAHYKKSLLNDLSTITDTEEQVTYLTELERDLGTTGYRKSVFCYDRRRTRARDVLHKFVVSERTTRWEKASAERKIREENLSGSRSRFNASSCADKPSPEKAYRIRTTMTVDTLAYFIKLMVNAKLIDPGVKTELMACIGSVFQTPSSGIDGISPGSLMNKYKLVTQNTAHAVKVHLSKMLKLLSAEFA